MKKYLFIVISLFVISCQPKVEDTTTISLFELVDPERSGIDFQNTIVENKTINYFKFIQLYMGAGVAVGDVNNDGLPDLYFNSNFTANKLYLNKGKLRFEDITESAGVGLNEGFRTGVNMVDINQDGWLDIYVCRSGWYKDEFIKKNLLYINNGDSSPLKGGKREVTFTESAESYGLADPFNSIQSSFFDYDKDGDLDMFLINTTTDFSFTKRMVRMDFVHQEEVFKNLKSNDKLYRNNGDNTFTDVSQEAGILPDIGFGLSVITTDIDHDGWTDIYIGNDFITPDYLYINQGDGTFAEKSKEYFKHTAFYSMGSDAADINNDGLTDLFVVDMMPKDYKRSKTSMAMVDPLTFAKSVEWGYNYQYKHNVLQLNNGGGSFSEISHLANVSKSDWSWSANIADLDNDGHKDIFITNGIKKYVTDQDFESKMEKRYKEKQFPASVDELLDELPSGIAPNFLYRNNGDLTFSDFSKSWGVDSLSYSTGCILADLDLDGDLDIVSNNSDAPVFLFENKSERTVNNYLRVALQGNEKVNELNTKVYLRDENGNTLQFQEAVTTRGYLSRMEETIHFGTGSLEEIPIVEVEWVDGRISRLTDVAVNQTIQVNHTSSKEIQKNEKPEKKLFADVTSKRFSEPFIHIENEFNDYEEQILLPHSQSNNGPALAKADVNGDGLEDFYVGGAHKQAGALFIQDEEGNFTAADMPVFEKDKNYEDIDALFFDADKDGDQDLYIVSGGSEFGSSGTEYQDRLYTNDNGKFQLSVNGLPQIDASGGCVTAGDFDKDGDTDLFVGGRVLPNQYPYPPKSYLLQNDGGRFTDVTDTVIPDARNIGMVTDAVWTDVDGDSNSELLLVGEWMRIEVFRFSDDSFHSITEDLGLSATRGWWNTIEASDVDNDGDTDFIAGNLGLNYKFHTSKEKPFRVHCSDFDDNGTFDVVLAKQEKNDYVPVRGKSCSSLQMPFIKEKYPTFDAFADATLSDIYGEKGLNEALTYEVQLFESVILFNNGGHFTIQKLPNQAQTFPVKDIVVNDFDHDGRKDMLLSGNNYGAEVETTRADAGIGLLLRGENNGQFTPVPRTESGFFTPYDSRKMAIINFPNNRTGILVANNNTLIQLIESVF